MKWLGISGGLGSGKTQVSQILREKLYPVVDADRLAREAVEPGQSAYLQIIEHFGPQVLDANKEIDRKALGRLVFDNPQARQKLESIVHPVVQILADRERQYLEQQGHRVAFYDVPLLFEKNLAHKFDGTICVYASPQFQIKRAMQRDSLSEVEVRKRIETQLPLREKAQMADYVIFNEGSLTDLDFEVRKMLAFFQT